MFKNSGSGSELLALCMTDHLFVTESRVVMSLCLLIIKKTLALSSSSIFYPEQGIYRLQAFISHIIFNLQRKKIYTVLIQYVQYKISTKGSFNAKIFL
jgi:hypothetical protein